MNEADRSRIAAALRALEGEGDTPPADARHAAVALLLRGAALDEAEVLLMRRARREGDRWSGQIGLPGGHAEPVDTDLVATARRESVEEVGVDPAAGDGAVLGALPVVQARARAQRLPLYITPFAFVRPDPPAPALGPEADEAFWLPLGPAMAGELAAEHRYRHDDGVVHRLPAWEFEGRTIWGMTHGILNRFLVALAATR